jgi:hypothetical protein
MNLHAKRSIPVMNILLCSAFLCGMTTSSAAQTVSPSGWQYELTPYLWASSIDGTTRIGPFGSSNSTSFSDLLKDLDFGLAATFEARRDR